MRSPTTEPSLGAATVRPRRSNQRGFTLLEILIAVTIIGVGFTALLGLHGSNIRHTVFNQQLSLATLLARDSVSQLQFIANTKGLDALSSSSGSFDTPGFRYEIEISETELEEVRRAVVRVIFDDRAPRACEVIYFIRGQV
ncbi:MAG TPA: prepilin-type N-terminal cleavage/methylation domain-containing protein [Terriglobales bacterium]|nr:prepilin-type N-terminal cleavage/methylation domain-containing protein [Terriglobales bacterium]